MPFKELAARLDDAIAWRREQVVEWIMAALVRLGPVATVTLRWPWPFRKPFQRPQLRVYAAGGGVGDELMCTPVFREIKRRNPACHLTFVSRYPNLFRSHVSLDAVLSFETDALQGAIPLNYGWVIPPPRPLVTLLGEGAGLSFFDNQLDPPEVEPAPELRERFARLRRRPIVIQPLASRWTPNKVWPVELWRQLIPMLLEDFDVIEAGTESLFSPGEFGPGFHAWAGTTSLEDFAWLISQAVVFVGPPSGGMHLANSFRVASVLLYGGYESPEGHRYPGATAFYRAVPCAPCWLREKCPYDLKCMRQISPTEVVAAVRHAARQSPAGFPSQKSRA